MKADYLGAAAGRDTDDKLVVRRPVEAGDPIVGAGGYLLRATGAALLLGGVAHKYVKCYNSSIPFIFMIKGGGRKAHFQFLRIAFDRPLPTTVPLLQCS